METVEVPANLVVSMFVAELNTPLIMPIHERSTGLTSATIFWNLETFGESFL